MKSPLVIAARASSPWQALFAGILTLVVVACSQAAPAGAGSAGAAGATTAGGGSGGGSGSMPKDVCALLSAAELQSATGIAFDAGKSVAVTGGLGCEWDAKSGLVSVNIFNLDHAQFVFNRDHLQGKPVPGVGDEAWAGGLSPEVSAAKGPLEIDVQVVAPGMTNDVTAAETALAKLVISRL
jgi:hypothetical protein